MVVYNMTADRQQATADFRRMMKWIVFVAALVVVGALTYLAITGDLTIDLIIATTLGVFFSILVGGGLMAASYFSDKSGHDQSVSDATSRTDL